MTIRRLLDIGIYLVLFNLYSLYRKIIPLKEKNNKKLIAVQTPDLEGNLVAVAKELKKKKDVHFYWIAYENKKFLQEMEKKGEECYYDLDIKKIPLFYNTNIFIGTPGIGRIPTKYFKPGKWVDLFHALGFKGFGGTSFVTNINRFDITCVSSDWFRDLYASWKIKREKIKVTGYARTDRLVNQKINKMKILNGLHISKNKKIILYAPTWEQESEFIKKLFPWKELNKDLKNINQFCSKNNCVFIIRNHKEWKNVKEKSFLKDILINQKKYPNIIYLPFDVYKDIESLLYITDVLITDWSSIASDFLLLGKPIIFFDIPSPYRHGVMLSPEDRVGYFVKTEGKFLKVLKKSISKPNLFINKRKKVFEKLYGKNKKYADGKAAKRCVKEILKLVSKN